VSASALPRHAIECIDRASSAELPCTRSHRIGTPAIGRLRYRQPVTTKRIRTASLVHRGGTRFDAQTGTGRRYVFGDDADANEYSPMETIAAAIGGCSAMDVVSILDKKRQVYDTYRVEVRADQRAEYPQVFTRVDVTHIVEGTVVLEAAVRRAVELSAAKYCPVNAMISAGATEVHHHFRMRCTGAEPKEAEGEVMVTGPDRRPDVVA
jgi:putative redox protein